MVKCTSCGKQTNINWNYPSHISLCRSCYYNKVHTSKGYWTKMKVHTSKGYWTKMAGSAKPEPVKKKRKRKKKLVPVQETIQPKPARMIRIVI